MISKGAIVDVTPADKVVVICQDIVVIDTRPTHSMGEDFLDEALCQRKTLYGHTS